MAEKGFGAKEINLIGSSGTPTIESPGNLNLNANNVAISTNVSIGGTLSVTGNISVGGTLTYEDVTNIDSVGIITARKGIVSSGVVTATAFDGGIKVVAANSVAATVYPVFAGTGATQSGNLNLKTDNSLTYNSLSGELTAVKFTGDGSSLTGIAVTEAPVVDYTITGDGSNYYFHGGGVDGSARDPDLYLIRGQKYRFNNTTGTQHPFRFTSTGNANAAYSKGVTGSESGVQFWTIPYDAPAKLFYVCTIHGGMVGNIYIRGANGQNDNVGLTTFKDNVSIVKSVPILELSTNTAGNDASIRLHESTPGSTSNGGGMFYSGSDNKLHITCGTTLTTKRITILRDDGKIGFNEDSPSKQFSYSYTQSANFSSSDAAYEFLLWNKADISSYATCGASIQLRAGNTSAGGGNISGVRRGSANQGDLAFSTTNASGNPVEKLRILSTGEMGLGTASPPTGTFTIHLTETPELNLFSTQHAQGNHCKLNFGVGQSASVSGNTGARIEMNIPNSGGAMNGELKFHTNSGDNLVEKVRIPAQTWGLLVTNLSSTGATGGYQTNGVSLRQGGDSTMVHDGGPPLTLTRKSNAGKVLDFYNGTTYAGGIYVNGNNQTALQQGSDYRLKTDITSMTDGINKVKQLNPIYYKSKEGFDTTTVQNGFLAHEVQSVLPTLVDGEKDAPIDEKGKGYQTLNYAGFTPTAIAAIKELIAKVETLEAKVAALEGS